ncbi:hypothetical protein ACRARG_04520 [Pseudooceanicola sp. C21-150M6]|uniref:hypothetical protein n=1 Tax=Pseudooceanicola sp. C21-150M6 TaxID=3434355 RepID=UPI003D7FCCC7
MTNVYAWPPVGLTGWELTTVDPVSRSVELFSGRARTSSFQRSRRYATAHVTGIGKDQNGAGYIENLKRLLVGGEHLVRIDAFPHLHPVRGQISAEVQSILEWTSSGTEMLWTSDGTSMVWGAGDYAVSGTPTTDGGWLAVSLTGLPPNVQVARPSQRIVISNGTDTEASTALAAATSDGSGNAVIRLFEAFTIEGLVSIGARESIVFEALDMPRSVMPATGTFGYQWDFREVFSDEYESWTELNPWP